MRFHINKQSEIHAHDQLREQIIFLISTGKLAIGDEVPSVRTLARQLGISTNTVSRVYAELVRANWLVKSIGARHKVVERRNGDGPRVPVISLDDLIDRTIDLAHAHGYPLQQLTNRLRDRLLEQPPDHFLIVEPERGMGEILREEIRERIGYSPPLCSISKLQENPAHRIGAILIAPAYLVDRLAQHSVDRRRVLSVTYSPLEPLIHAISQLSRPSMIGWVSVSDAGLKTISGMTAPHVVDLHSNHFFLFEHGDANHHYRIRRYRPEEYHPSDILKPATVMKASSLDSSNQTPSRSKSGFVSSENLNCMDLLFCDSVTASSIKHPRLIRYQLLSEASLDRIEAEATALPRPGKA